MAKKSLGQLTIDIVAQTGGFTQGMSKAERVSKKWRKEVESNLKQTGKQLEQGLKVSAAAAAAAFGALTAATIQQTRVGLENIDSQNKLARSLNTTFDSVTALSLAFSENGIDGYEMSLARLNRRLGAAENGSGEAAKTVEALNLNLSELSGLDADERLARIADAIVESGASAQQAARYAQQLGFEQREAAQMFLQGGDAIRAYRKQVDEFGLSVSAIDAVKVEQANDAFARTGLIFDSISQQLAIQVAPILSGLSELFVQNAKDAGGVGEATAEAFNVVIEGAAEAANRIAILNRWFLRGQAAADVFALHVRNGFLEIAREIVEIPTAAVNELITTLNAFGANIEPLGLSDLGRDVQGLIDGTKNEIKQINSDLAEELGKPLPGDQFKRFVFEAREAAEQSAEAMAKIQEASGLEPGTGSGSGIAGGSSIDKDFASRRDALIQGFESERDEIRRQFKQTQEEINELEQVALEDGGLTQMQAADLRVRNEEQMQKRLKEIRQNALDEEAALQKQRQALLLGSSEELFGSLAALTGQFVGEQTALYKTLFVAEKAFAIGRALINAPEAYSEAYNAVVGIPVVGPALAPAAGATAAAAQIAQAAAIRTVGMAHDGIDSVPQEGTWLLDKGERVLTSPQADNLDAFLAKQAAGGGSGTVVNVIEDNSRAGETETKRGSNGQEEVNVFVADIMGGGPRAKAMQTAFGLKRQGY